jgi:hypothetical protein
VGKLLSVLAAVVSLWAWAQGKWEKVKGWMKERAMSVQVEGWKGTREGGKEGGREGGREGLKGWMQEKAMGVQVEGWKGTREGGREKVRIAVHHFSMHHSSGPSLPPSFPALLLDHGKALLLRLQWGATQTGSSISTTLKLSLDELKSQGKGREGWREGGREGGCNHPQAEFG